MARQNNQQMSDALHRVGSKRYGGKWLKANQIAIDTMRTLGMDYTRHKALGAAMAFQLCSVAETGLASLGPEIIRRALTEGDEQQAPTTIYQNP